MRGRANLSTSSLRNATKEEVSQYRRVGTAQEGAKVRFILAASTKITPSRADALTARLVPNGRWVTFAS